jgi:hypothetical protein
MRAEQKRGVAEPPSEEAKKTDLIENQAVQAIQRTQKETDDAIRRASGALVGNATGPRGPARPPSSLLTSLAGRHAPSTGLIRESLARVLDL